MLDLRRLEILERFAVLGTITAVAADLGYSPSAISQQLSTLEREAGVGLLERTAHSAMLTDAGRELAAHAVTVLAAVEQAQSSMRQRAGTIGGRVEVSCIPGLAARLAPHLASLQRRHPDLRIVARETESAAASAAVLQGRSDMAVVDDWTEDASVPTAGLAVHVLNREPVVLAVPAEHAWAERVVVTPTGLEEIAASETWLCAPFGQLSRAAGDQRLASLGIEPAQRWEFEGLHVLAALVATGAGVAFLPVGIIDEQAKVIPLQLRPQMFRRVIALTRSSNQRDPAVASCLDAARLALST